MWKKSTHDVTKKYFNTNETSVDGYQSYCRSCQKKKNTEDALKLMRKGGPKTKIRKPHPPKLPQFTPDKLFKRNK